MGTLFKEPMMAYVVAEVVPMHHMEAKFKTKAVHLCVDGGMYES